MSDCLDEVGICFMFAQRHHPAMKHVAAVRKALGVKTIFNVLGPLTNPARATHQMVGVYNKQLTEQFARVLKVLGAERAVAVHGSDGLDEISTAASTFISEYNGKEVLSYEIAPEDFGIKRVREDELKGGDPAENAGLMTLILQGKGMRAHMDVVALNSAFALYAAEAVASPQEGVERVREVMALGKPMEKLLMFREFSNRGR
jgi:anthranilate phosphoribosyltransferase